MKFNKILMRDEGNTITVKPIMTGGGSELRYVEMVD